MASAGSEKIICANIIYVRDVHVFVLLIRMLIFALLCVITYHLCLLEPETSNLLVLISNDYFETNC